MIGADALYDITRIRDAAVSPTGERVAFLTQEYDPDEEESVNSLWVAPTDGSREPHRLTRASDGSSPAWSPDGSMLAFVATRERDPALRVGRDDESDDDTAAGADDGTDDADDTGGAGDPKPQVWAFDMALGGDAVQLTDREEGVSAFDWGPDGDRLVVAARDPTEEEQAYLDQREENGPIEVERLQHKYDGKGYLDEVTSYLFVVDVASRETERIDEANDGGHGAPGGLQPAWGPGDRIAYVASHTEWPDDSYVTDIYTIDPAGEDRRKLTDSDHATASPVWSPDGERLAFTARQPDNWYVPTELCVTDGTECWTVTDGIDRTLGRVAPQWVDEETLVALIGDEGQTRFLRCDIAGDTERVYERQDSLETVGTMDLGGGTVVFQASVPTAGADLFALGADELTAPEAERTRLTRVNDDFLDDHQIPDCRRLRFEGARGDDVEGLLYYPGDFDPEDPDERGLILSIHGGPMTYDAPGFRFQNAYFTSRGYLVFRVNYHGSTSYGRDFCESLNGEWGTHEVTDLLAGVDELLDRGWADPDRLFPTGFSQGGVNTGYLVTQDDRWAAAAAEHGIYDLRSSFGTDDSQNWLEADFGLPWENPEAYDEASAITEVENVETPLLVTAGENDHRCPPSQSEQLYVSVRKQGVDAKLVIYPDEHHNVGDPDRAIHRLKTLDSWFASYDPERESEEESPS